MTSDIRNLPIKADSTMKITLVNPPYPPSVHSHPPFIPLGLAYLGAVAEKAGHQVKVIDCQAEKLTYETFRSRIAETPSDFIGATSTTLLYKSAMHILTIAKETQPSMQLQRWAEAMAPSGTKTHSKSTQPLTSSYEEKAN